MWLYFSLGWHNILKAMSSPPVKSQAGGKFPLKRKTIKPAQTTDATRPPPLNNTYFEFSI